MFCFFLSPSHFSPSLSQAQKHILGGKKKELNQKSQPIPSSTVKHKFRIKFLVVLNSTSTCILDETNIFSLNKMHFK